MGSLAGLGLFFREDFYSPRPGTLAYYLFGVMLHPQHTGCLHCSCVDLWDSPWGSQPGVIFIWSSTFLVSLLVHPCPLRSQLVMQESPVRSFNSDNLKFPSPFEISKDYQKPEPRFRVLMSTAARAPLSLRALTSHKPAGT